jgi:hypothetical protein
LKKKFKKKKKNKKKRKKIEKFEKKRKDARISFSAAFFLVEWLLI